jgi:hypothetical protein
MSHGAPRGHTFQGTPDEATDDLKFDHDYQRTYGVLSQDERP